MSRALISHIGIAVGDLQTAIKRYGILTGDEKPLIEEMLDQKVRVAIFSRSNKRGCGAGGCIELVSATGPDSPVASFLAKRGEGLHHICVYVKDIEKKLSELKEKGVRLIDEKPRIGAGGTRIAFVHPTSMNGVLVELEEIPGR